LGRKHHETHLSAQQGSPRPHARVPCTYGDRERPQDSRPPPRQGPQEADPLIADAHPPLRFSAERRLRRKVDFDTTYQQGRRYGDALLSMTVRSNSHGGPRLGLAIAARTVGNAVARNRLRRIIRDTFRLAQHGLPAAYFVIGARAGVRGAEPARIRASLAALFAKVVR
jgi:ribonuclease P protein component